MTIELRHGGQEASVDLDGGRLTSYRVGGREVVAAEPDSPPASYRSSLLAPWPNRVAGGGWTWEGEGLLLPVNEHALGTALHGLVAFARFQLVAADERSARVRYDLAPSPGYPFRLRVEASYALADDGLRCTLEAEATGDCRTPVGLGVHPYLRCRGAVDDVVLTLPASRLVQGDEQWAERSRPPVAGTEDDFRSGRPVGDREIDACWTDLSRVGGRVRCAVRFPDGDQVEVWGGATTRYLVVFTAHTLPGDLRRASIAVEPNTAPANAFRSGTDLDVLEPGERLVLDWGLTASWL